MSSISFPHPGHGRSASSASAHEPSFYAPPFEANSSFQMNPLSSHPPRTPRTSIVSSSTQVYGSSIYDAKDEAQEEPSVVEEEFDEDGDRAKEAERKIRKEDVWREMFLTSNGRDKAFVRAGYTPSLRGITEASLQRN